MAAEENRGDHLSILKREPGPTIVGELVADSDEKISLLTTFGIYDISKADVAAQVSDGNGKTQITVTRGAKILFCQLIDAESLLARNKASLAHVAQGAKQLQWALNRVLGKTEIPAEPTVIHTDDCPMCDCTDCCQCPVIEDSGEAPSRSGVRMEYYERQIGRGAEKNYRDDKS